ncbi:permease [Limimaricola litoreus]|uniref:Permease n=1 Tax=Limimaricola litoreus TaxID=2955316 RepID=A0A9X2JMM3_9RHOB|nr:permease [Limimaricola litoreus]MCP1167322.1 permease [Limimaricola litoreus]
MARFVVFGLVSVAPLVVPGIVLAAWIMASGADAHIVRAFEGQVAYSIIAAAAVGAITPVCGITVLPLMAGLLAAGIPLAPIMAFWLSSPITDPAMLAATAATLGFGFAAGKTVAAFGLGLWGGSVTSIFARQDWATAPLRRNRIVGRLSQKTCGAPLPFEAQVWTDPGRREVFRQNFVSTTRLILICLIPAFAAEYALNATLKPEALSAYVGDDVWWAIPFAVFVGAPAYLDGYAALPLTRSLMDHGMSPGAAMAFLVSGGVVSIWGAMAIFPVLRLKPFLLYLALAISGSLIAGYLFDSIV